MPATEFPTEPGAVLLNHASFGLPTTALMQHAEQIRRNIERDAAHYLAGPMADELREQAAAAESFLAARPGALALVANSTEASSAVASSMARDRKLRVVLLDSEYPSVIRAWQVATAPAGGTVQLVTIPLPAGSAADILAAVDDRVRGEFDVLVVSLIASSTALLLPVRQLAEWARSRGAATVVDAAHGAGHIDLRVEDLGATVVFGTLHKWLPVPRPVGFLWASAAMRDDVRPAAVALRWDDGLFDRFTWRGTWDPAPALCLTAALAQWRQWEEAGRHRRAEQLMDIAAQRLSALGLIATGAGQLLAPRLRSFIVPDIDTDGLNAALDKASVRAWVGSSADGQTLLRIATHVHTTGEDLDRLVDAARQIAAVDAAGDPRY